MAHGFVFGRLSRFITVTMFYIRPIYVQLAEISSLSDRNQEEPLT